MPSIARFEKRPEPGRRRRIALRVGVAVVLALILTRLLLPVVVTRLVNARLAELENHTGRVESAGFRLARGEIALDQLVFERRGANEGALRVEVEKINVSISWMQLARGKLSAGIIITRPMVVYSAGPARAEPADRPEAVRDPRDVLAGVRRFEITRLEIVDGTAMLEWPVGERTQTLTFSEVWARFANLSNEPATREKPVATAEIEARLPGGGTVAAQANGAPLASVPFVHVRAEIDELDLTLLNPIFIEALGTDISEGRLRVDAEFRAAEGYYEGYLAPFVRDAQFTRPRGDAVSFGEGVRAKILDAAARVLSNDETERVASKVPFSGRFGDGDVDGWTAFTTLLGNAFGEALRAGRAGGE